MEIHRGQTRRLQHGYVGCWRVFASIGSPGRREAVMDRTTRYVSFVERPTNMTGQPCVGPAAWLRQIPDTNLPLGNNPRPIAEERSRSIPRGCLFRIRQVKPRTRV